MLSVIAHALIPTATKYCVWSRQHPKIRDGETLGSANAVMILPLTTTMTSCHEKETL